jgi:hypothetical protein
MIRARVSDNDEARLHELFGDLVREGTGSVAVGQVLGSSVLSVLEDGAGSEGTSTDDTDIRAAKVSFSQKEARFMT